jgi:hypothetical protein
MLGVAYVAQLGGDDESENNSISSLLGSLPNFNLIAQTILIL